MGSIGQPLDSGRLERLVASWHMLADFSFSDLMLYERHGDQLRVVAHVRPTTSQTMYPAELVGEVRSAKQRPLVSACFARGEILHDEVDSRWLGERIGVWCIPVVDGGEVIAVLARESPTEVRLHPGELERRYEQVFGRFATMIANGLFPYAHEPVVLANPARVGDGVLIFGATGRVEFASPNANSALNRSGFAAPFVGRRFQDFGVDDKLVQRMVNRGEPLASELQVGSEVTVSVHGFPLLSDTGVDGAVVLIRDITDVRRRDRLLVTKDATIQEIHHRVKNNLQTVSSLLRLQERRVREPEAKAAIADSVRRVQSIALVHEMLSLEINEDVELDSLIRPLLRIVRESLESRDQEVRVEVVGTAGLVGSKVATGLSLIVTELVQNAATHGRPSGPISPVEITLGESEEDEIRLAVRDWGSGFGERSDVARKSLGLSIVESLVQELDGTLTLEDAHPGARVIVQCPAGVSRPATLRGVGQTKTGRPDGGDPDNDEYRM